ncbi:unnamed protein product [Pleuronectes platessa]|uniref:Uncharacterized protein n=1 Tax=Pleuronectes platessa TaxID=8262 RepID=A0A9N7VYJ5_PLEPL|nr:unnamed protein product [Pleuronectes platessa]
MCVGKLNAGLALESTGTGDSVMSGPPGPVAEGGRLIHQTLFHLLTLLYSRQLLKSPLHIWQGSLCTDTTGRRQHCSRAELSSPVAQPQEEPDSGFGLIQHPSVLSSRGQQYASSWAPIRVSYLSNVVNASFS